MPSTKSFYDHVVLDNLACLLYFSNPDITRIYKETNPWSFSPWWKIMQFKYTNVKKYKLCFCIKVQLN